jgi:hypothetical protein
MALAACLVALALAACSTASKTQQLADSVTKAVYNNDYSAVVADMDAQLTPSVTRSEVGDLSDRMHKLGDYSGLTQITSDDVGKKYSYIAKFSKGAMIVEIRLDSDGKIAAYRVIPQQLPG